MIIIIIKASNKKNEVNIIKKKIIKRIINKIRNWIIM